MAATERYLGATTAFGVIIHIEDRLYNAIVTVEAKDGSTSEYRLPFLIAHGLTLPRMEHLCQGPINLSSSHSASDLAHPSNDTPTMT